MADQDPLNFFPKIVIGTLVVLGLLVLVAWVVL